MLLGGRRIYLETISEWLATVHTFIMTPMNVIKSKIDNLADTEILFEITSKDDSVLQTLIITKHV